jgi:ABC-type antimicrobial peptide transport system ATPase subunit
VYEFFPRLKQRRGSMAGYTSGGEQQMTAIGRALMARPRMILLDEPSMGLAPQIVEEIFEIVKNLNAYSPAMSQVRPGARRGISRNAQSPSHTHTETPARSASCCANLVAATRFWFALMYSHDTSSRSGGMRTLPTR